MQRKYVQFNKSMNIDKRNENFAYLSKNVLDVGTKGLYPSRDFISISPTNDISGSYVIAIIGRTNTSDSANNNPKILVRDGSTTRFYRLGNSSVANTAGTYDVRAVSYDSRETGPYFVDDSGDKVYMVTYNNSNIIDIADFPSAPQVEIGGFDGLYHWWIGNKIWRQLSDETPELIMSDSGLDPSFIEFYENFICIVEQRLSDVHILFYDKSNTTFFEKRKIIKDANVLALGNIQDKLTLVYSQSVQGNMRELESKIIISQYDGYGFSEINSIKGGRYNPSAPDGEIPGQSCKVYGDFMVFAVDNNDREQHNPDLAVNYIYKVFANGAIQALTTPIPNSASLNYANVVAATDQGIVYAQNSSGGNPIKIYSNRDNSRNFTNYQNFTTTEYITNFYCNPENGHSLKALNVTFEKMFNNSSNVFPPNASPGTLAITEIENTSFKVNWTKATDLITPQEELQYQVYVSNVPIVSLGDIETYGEVKVSWTADINTATVTGLDQGVLYYVNVVVRDNQGLKTAYSGNSATTFAGIWTDWESPSSNFACWNTIGGTPIQAWTNPQNAYTDNDTYTTAEMGDIAYQSYGDFGFNIPGGATILGIEMRIKARSSNPGAQSINTKLSKAVGLYSGGYTDYFNQTSPNGRGTQPLTNTKTTFNLGGVSDTWGGYSLTETDVNSSAFGLTIEGTAGSSPTTTNYQVDHIEMRIAYLE